MNRLTVFVPQNPELREKIWKGSGIVGSVVSSGETDRLRLDFEGNQGVFPSFRERVQRAAERHTWEERSGQGYPSSAVAYTDRQAVEAVGWWDCEDQQLEIEKPKVLSRWLENETE